MGREGLEMDEMRLGARSGSSAPERGTGVRTISCRALLSSSSFLARESTVQREDNHEICTDESSIRERSQRVMGTFHPRRPRTTSSTPPST